MATGNTDFGTDGLLASTISHYVPKLEDQIFTSKPLLYILRQRMENQHGNSIVQPLLYGELSSKGSFSGEDVFAAPSASGITASEYLWKQYYASVKFTGIELAKNSGREAILSLLKARLTQAEMSIAEDLNSMLFLDGTGNGGKDFEGLAKIVEDGNTYGNIDRTDANNAWWRSHVDSTAGALSPALMRSVYNTVSEGNDQPSNILTTQDGFEAYEALLTDQIRYEDTEMGDLGFINLMFKKAPIVFDRDCQDATMYFLNVKYLHLTKLNNVWFDVSDWLRPVNQDSKYKNILLYGNLTASNCKRQGKLDALTDA